MDYLPCKGAVWAEFLFGALLLGSYPNFCASHRRARWSGGAGRFVRGTEADAAGFGRHGDIRTSQLSRTMVSCVCLFWWPLLCGQEIIHLCSLLIVEPEDGGRQRGSVNWMV